MPPASPTSPLPKLLFRREGRIEGIFAGHGVVVVHTSDFGHSVTVHDRESGRLLRELVHFMPGPGPFERHVAIAADRRSIFCSFFDDRLVQIDIDSGETLRSVPITLEGAALRSHDKICVSPRGDVVHVAMWGELLAWDLEANVLRKSPCRPWLGNYGMATSLDGETLWIDGNELQRFTLATGIDHSARHEKEGGGADSVYLAASDCLGIGRYDGVVEFWSTGAPPSRLAALRVGPDPFHTMRVASLRGGAFLVVSSADQRINILAPSDAFPRKRLGGMFSDVWSLGSDDADTVFVGDEHGGVWRFDLAGDSLEAPPPPPKGKTKAAAFPMTNHFHCERGFGETPMVRTAPGRTLSIGGFQASPPLDRDACAWERGREDAIAYRGFGRRKVGYELAVVAGRFVVIDDGGSNLLALDATTLATAAKLPHKGVKGAAANGEGNRLITTGGTEIKVWSTQTWEVVASRQNPEVPQRAVQWIAGQDLVLFLDKNDALGFLSAEDLKRRVTRKIAGVESVVADREGTFVACETGTQVHVWNVASGDIVALPAGTSCPVFLDEGKVAVLDRRGTSVASYRTNGKLVRSVELAAKDVRGKPSTEARMWGEGTRVAVACRDYSRTGPEYTELDVIDLATGEAVASRAVARGIGSLVFDGDDIAYLTSGGRVEWLEAPR